MNDSINIFINNHTVAIIFILFIVITYWLRSEVEKLVDGLLTMKNLKATLFIVFVFIIFLVMNTFYNFTHIDVSLIAPYMVAMSALLASLVAIINMRKSYMERVVDRSDKVIVLTHLGIMKIQFFTEKSKLLKLMLVGESKIQYDMLIEYEIMLRDISTFLNREDLYRFESHDIYYEVHNDIIIFLTILKKIIRDIEKNYENFNGKVRNFFDNSESYEKLIENLKQLMVVLEDIKIEETKEHQKLYEEQ